MRPLLSPFFLDRPSCQHEPRVFAASDNGLPASNAGTVEAALIWLSPVLRLRPARTGRLRMPNVPKPRIPRILALGQNLRDRLECGIDGVAGHRLSDACPFCHAASDGRLAQLALSRRCRVLRTPRVPPLPSHSASMATLPAPGTIDGRSRSARPGIRPTTFAWDAYTRYPE